jgi:hypothetical protein
MKVHPIFTVKLFSPTALNPLPSQPCFTEYLPHVVDGEEEYGVEEILNPKLDSSGILKYLVLWKGYS